MSIIARFRKEPLYFLLFLVLLMQSVIMAYFLPITAPNFSFMSPGVNLRRLHFSSL